MYICVFACMCVFVRACVDYKEFAYTIVGAEKSQLRSLTICNQQAGNSR